MTTVSAPGKVHLIGDHAIVYNEPAILAAVGLRTTVKAEKSDMIRYIDKRFSHDDTWDINEVRATTENALELWNKGSTSKDFSELFSFIKKDRYANYKKAVVGLALKKLDIDGGISVEIDSQIPGGAGIGSSASLHACLVKAISYDYGKKIDIEKINEISFELEKVIHGTPSGGDNTTVCFGGLLWFQKSNSENIIKPLRNEIPYSLENFVLVYTKPPEKTTGELVQIVRNLDEDYRNKRIREIGKLTHQMFEALKRKDSKKMKEIINRDQELLSQLGVSISEIDVIAKAVRKIGGAAKLCGAGGGGMVLCHNENYKELLQLIGELGYKPINAELGVEGVRLES